MKRYVIVACVMLVFPHMLFAQEVFSNGVDVSGAFVFGNGMITLESTTNTQDDAMTRDLAPSVGQIFGVDPDTGNTIALNGDLLTFKPRVLDLTVAGNRLYVIAADQIVGSSAVQVGYVGSNLVLSIPAASITTSELDLNSVDSRYVELSDDISAGQLTNALHLVAFTGDGTSVTNLDWNNIVLNMPAGFADGTDDAGDASAWATNPAVANVVLTGNWLSGDGDQEGLTVDGTGNIGVGTNAPSAMLHVAGSARFEEGITFIPEMGDLSMGSYTNTP